MKLIIDIEKLEQLGIAKVIREEEGTNGDMFELELHQPTKSLRADAIELINFLNEKTGKNFPLVDANIKPLIARIKEHGKQKMQQMIARQTTKWKNDEKMQDYLRPKTLFKASNCAQYIGDLVKPR